MGQASLSSTNSSLLIRLRDANDDEAWRFFVETYVPAMMRYCQRRGVQDADARDVVQDILSNVAAAIRSFEYDRQRGKFRSWLGTVTRNALIRHLQRSERPGRAQGDDEIAVLQSLDGESDPEWIDAFELQILRSALGRIQDEFCNDTWRAFDMVWERDLPAAQAAEHLGRSVGWVYKAKFRILQRLKKEVLFLAEDCGLFGH